MAIPLEPSDPLVRWFFVFQGVEVWHTRYFWGVKTREWAFSVGMLYFVNLSLTLFWRGFFVSNKWIVDVLTDLKSFANANDLPVLSSQLGDAIIVALAEIDDTHPADPQGQGWDNGDENRKLPGTIGQSQDIS